MNAGDGPDGGIDVLAIRGQEKVIVQCKHWRSDSVGVAIVREMFGVMVAEQASSVHVVTSGTFTQAAREFAINQPIELIDGNQLLDIIKQSKKLLPLKTKKVVLA